MLLFLCLISVSCHQQVIHSVQQLPVLHFLQQFQNPCFQFFHRCSRFHRASFLANLVPDSAFHFLYIYGTIYQHIMKSGDFMEYIITGLVVYILLSMMGLFKYFKCKRDYDTLQKSHLKEISRLNTALSEAQENFKKAQADVKNLRAENQALSQKVASSSHEDTGSTKNLLLMFREKLYDQEKELNQYRRSHVWGKLFSAYRHVYETLTPEQERLVNYPPFTPQKVFYASSSKSYHAVKWCYTLEKSFDIDFCSAAEAKACGLKPCSKCVAPECRQ